jgi:hypothetical protein
MANNNRNGVVKRRAKRLLKRLAIIMVLFPIAAWALDEAARRAESRRQGPSPMSERLWQGAEVVGRRGRGPLAKRVRERHEAGHPTA